MLDEYQRDEAILHFQRGVVLERANRVEEAVEEYRRAIARYPHLREAHDALGFYYQRYGLLAKAAAEFRVVANLEDDFLSHFNLGYVLMELTRHDEAIEAFQHCIEHLPGDPAAHYEIAYLKFVKGEYIDALTHLQIANAHYAEDWEIHKLRGRCMLQLKRFDEAQVSFEKARKYALRPAVCVEIDAELASVQRHREIESQAGLKARLYLNHGAVHLGSAQDDGLNLREADEYHFTYPDIAATIRRLHALVATCSWRFSCVVALDRLAHPLASAFAAQFAIPVCDFKELAPDAVPLLVLAVGREAELLDLIRERGPARGVVFCLGVNWLRHSQAVPDISGVLVRGACSVPWEPELRRLRAVGAAAEQIARCLQIAAEQIAASTRDLDPAADLGPQIDYYARNHRLLRFAPHITGPLEG